MVFVESHPFWEEDGVALQMVVQLSPRLAEDSLLSFRIDVINPSLSEATLLQERRERFLECRCKDFATVDLH